MCFYKYQNFLYNLEDLSIFNNVLWNTAHGKLFWFSSHGGFSYLGDHLELGLLMILPIYYFFQSPLTLLFLQTVLFGLSAWPVYLIVRCHCEERSDEAIPMPIRNQRDCFASLAMTQTGSFRTFCRNDKKQWLPLLIALIFLLNPFIHNINLEEFHLAPLLLFFFLWTFYFYLRKKYRLFILFFVLTLLLREDAALTLGALAMIAAWDNRHFLWRAKKWWLYPLIISIIWFLASLKIINFFNPDSGYRFLILYQHLNIYDPLTWLARLFNAKTLSLIVGYLLAFLFLPLYRPKYLFLALPAFLQATLLDAGASSTSYFTHHQLFILAALFLATAEAMIALARSQYKKYLSLIFLFLIISQIYISLFLGPLKILYPSAENNLTNLEDKEMNREMIALLPPEASLSGPYRFMPRLSSREKAYLNKLTFLGKKHLAIGDFSLPADTGYWLIDTADMIEYFLHFQNRDCYSQLYWGGAERMRQTIAQQHFQPIALTDSLILLKKDAAPSPLPYQIVDQLPTNLSGEKKDWGEMEFLGWSSLRRDSSAALPPVASIGMTKSINLYFKPKRPITDNYFFEITALDANQKAVWQKIYPPAYGLLPTHDWPANQYVMTSQILPAGPAITAYQISLIKIKGNIELGPLNDTQLIIDEKEKIGESFDIFSHL